MDDLLARRKPSRAEIAPLTEAVETMAAAVRKSDVNAWVELIETLDRVGLENL